MTQNQVSRTVEGVKDSPDRSGVERNAYKDKKDIDFYMLHNNLQLIYTVTLDNIKSLLIILSVNIDN